MILLWDYQSDLQYKLQLTPRIPRLCRLSSEALMSNAALDNSSTSVGHRRFQSAKVLTPLMAKTKNKRVHSLGEPTNELMY